ncbi:integrase family protein, partial [human gut metagenome]
YAKFITATTNDRKEIKKDYKIKLQKKKKYLPMNKLLICGILFPKVMAYKKKENKTENSLLETFWLMLLYCGCRADELLSIYSANVFLDENYFIGGLKTEAGINRTIPIHPAIKPLFEKYYNPDNEFLFMQPNGNKIDYDYYLYHYKYNFKDLHTFVSEHTAHDCRHTLRTELEKLNIKQVIINSIIGHSNENVGQDVYTHIPLEEKQAAINMIEYKNKKSYIF